MNTDKIRREKKYWIAIETYNSHLTDALDEIDRLKKEVSGWRKRAKA